MHKQTVYSKSAEAIYSKIMRLLDDGRVHTRDEIHALCGPSKPSVVRLHICKLRKKLKPEDEIIWGNFGGIYGYRLMRRVSNPFNGST